MAPRASSSISARLISGLRFGLSRQRSVVTRRPAPSTAIDPPSSTIGTSCTGSPRCAAIARADRGVGVPRRPLLAPRVEAEVQRVAESVVGASRRSGRCRASTSRRSGARPRRRRRRTCCDRVVGVVRVRDHRDRLVRRDRAGDLRVHRARAAEPGVAPQSDLGHRDRRPRHERAFVTIGLGRHARTRGRHHARKLASAHAADARTARARATRVELGTLGRRRPARDAEPHHARRRAARRRRRPHRASVLARDPVRPDRAAVGQREHARAGEPRAAHATPSTSRSPATRADFTTSDDSFRMGSQAATHLGRARARRLRRQALERHADARSSPKAGAARLGIEHVGPVATRGVLLDIARLHGVDHFDENYAITGDDLDAAAAARASRCSPATRCSCAPGRCTSSAPATGSATRMPSPGLSTQSIEWLRDHDVAAGRHRHDDVRGLPVRGPEGVHARAHDPAPRHGPRAGRRTGTSTTSRPTARPTASTTSCSSRRRCRSPARSARPVAPTAIK